MQLMSPERADWAVPRMYAIRRQRALTQQELADRSGVSLTTINRLERGYTARPQTIRKLAEALGVEPSALLSELEQEP
jgi:transcriptional regulator with XRE-family HTH domain